MEFTLYEWLHQSPRNVVHEDYYGNMLNGPNCEKVLRPETLRAMFEYVLEDLHKYVYALKQVCQNPQYFCPKSNTIVSKSFKNPFMCLIVSSCIISSLLIFQLQWLLMNSLLMRNLLFFFYKRVTHEQPTCILRYESISRCKQPAHKVLMS